MPFSERVLADRIDYMKSFPDKFFNLALLDPEYGINATNMTMGSNPNRSRNDGYGSGPAISTAQKIKKGRLNSGGGKLKNRKLNTSDIDWDNAIPDEEYFEQVFRVSINQAIWGGNYFPLPPTRCIMCWNKMQPWENFSQFELAWTSFDKPAMLLSLSNTGGGNHEQKIHPTQKPVPVYKWQLKRLAEMGDKICDFGMGSQSSAIAAFQMGYDYWGCDNNESYITAGNKRFSEQTKQQDLFI